MSVTTRSSGHKLPSAAQLVYYGQNMRDFQAVTFSKNQTIVDKHSHSKGWQYYMDNQ